MKKPFAFILLLMSISTASATNVSRQNVENIVILTNRSFKPIAEEYANWKRTMGFQVEVAARNWENYAVVRLYLDSIYYEKEIDYLLILGNQQIVPANRTSRILNTGAYNGRYAYRTGNYSHFTDYYFTTIPGNANKRVKCGRIAVDNIVTAAKVLKKIRRYEEYLPTNPTDSYYNSALHIAYYEDDPVDKSVDDEINHEDYRFLFTTEEIIGHLSADHVSPISNFTKIYTRNNTSNVSDLHWNNTLYGQGGNVPSALGFVELGVSDTINTTINNGVLYTMYYDHGNESQWSHPLYYASQTSNLTNGSKLPVVFCCCCKNFLGLANNTFAEKFIENENGGAVGLVAASDVILTGLMDVFIERAFNAVWPHEGFFPVLGEELQQRVDTDSMICRTPVNRLGDIVMTGLNDMESYFKNTVLDSYSHQNDTVSRQLDDFPLFIQHMKEIMHIIGDPSMEMYTDNPHFIANPTITYVNGNICVSLHDGEATITLYNKDTNDVVSFIGNYAIFPHQAGNLILSIHRPNSNVKIMRVGDVFIQNEVIDGNCNVSARNVVVGNQVTTAKPYGNVVFQKGSDTNISAINIKVSSSTSIKKGAMLKTTTN